MTVQEANVFDEEREGEVELHQAHPSALAKNHRPVSQEQQNDEPSDKEVAHAILTLLEHAARAQEIQSLLAKGAPLYRKEGPDLLYYRHFYEAFLLRPFFRQLRAEFHSALSDVTGNGQREKLDALRRKTLPRSFFRLVLCHLPEEYIKAYPQGSRIIKDLQDFEIKFSTTLRQKTPTQLPEKPTLPDPPRRGTVPLLGTRPDPFSTPRRRKNGV